MKTCCFVTSLGKYINPYQHSQEPSLAEQFLGVAITLFISFCVYCIPVIIFRFGIRRGKPLESNWKATWVGCIFWVCSFTVFCLYYLIAGYYDEEGFSVRAGIPDFLCLLINFLILRLGDSSSSIPQNTPPRPSSPYVPNPSVPSKPSPDSSGKCTKCGFLLSPNDAFCSMCGQKVTPPIPPGMTLCHKCGQIVKQGKFCSECGKNLPIDYQKVYRETAASNIRVDSLGNIKPSPPQANPSITNFSLSKSGTIALVVFIAFFVLVFFAFCFYLIYWI